jgi:hypothetical protein
VVVLLIAGLCSADSLCIADSLCSADSISKATEPVPTPTPLDDESDPAVVTVETDPLADRLHRRISKSVLMTAEAIDAFFYTDQTEIEENQTVFKISLGLFVEAEEETRLETRSRLKLVLPGFQDQLHLILTGDPETVDEVFGEAVDAVPEETLSGDETGDGAGAALRYFVLDDIKRNLSFSAGVRIRDSQLVGFPEARYRRLFDMDNEDLALRFEQRVLWYTDDGWRESSRVDMDVLLKERYLWRTSLIGVWTETDGGYNYHLSFKLFYKLWKRAALSYEWDNAYNLCTDGQLDEILFKIGYRQSFWRPWLFFELIPQLSFPESEDFKNTPGIRFRIEAIFGHYRRTEPARK